VTLHGGLAVAALQLVTLLLYRYSLDNAWCYLPMLTVRPRRDMLNHRHGDETGA
jgi:hypothetical protein